jgi:endoglycosylceramidase
MRPNRTISLLALTIILGTVIVGNATVSAQITGFLSVQGTWIVDNSGKPILLRGVNYPGYQYPNPRLHSESAYANFAEMGFNVVRLQISWANLEPRKGQFDNSFLMWYVDRDVQLAKRYGLYIVLDMHQDRWASKFGGDGAPDWAVRQYPANETGMRMAVSDFWADPSLQDHLVMVWKNIAAHYAKEPNIAGYDLLNEPWIYTSINPELNASNINSFYAKTTEAIRSVDQNHIIFLEPANMNTFNTSFDSKIAWSPHFYSWAFATTYYPENVTILENDMEAKYETFVLKLHLPMWIGEFGAFMKDQSAERWLEDAKALFDEYQVGWAWWGDADPRGQTSIPDCLKNPSTCAVQILMFQPLTITPPKSWLRFPPLNRWIFWN